MNIIQIFVALALFAISRVSAQLTITAPTATTLAVVGMPISVTVTGFGSGSVYSLTFTDSFGNSFTETNLLLGTNNVTPKGLLGSVSLVAAQGSVTSTAVSFTMALPTLRFTSPSGVAPDVTYGEAVILNVATNGPSQVQYTASFSCPTGSYQITGLTTAVSYSIVPAGIYGQVVITVTATGTSPGTLAMTITNPSANIPPSFIPGRLPYFPSVYANMKNGKDLEIVSVDYKHTAPM